MLHNSSIPSDFIHLLQDREYLEATLVGERKKIIGVDGSLGARLSFGPFCVEYYTSDQEPIILPFRGFRFILWCPITRGIPPKGWLKAPFATGRMVFAYVDIRDQVSYRNNLNKTLRNAAHVWKRQQEYKIEEVTYPVFEKLYEKHGRPKRLINIVKAIMRHHLDISKSNNSFFLLESTITGEVVAGVSGTDYPYSRQSYYMSSFTRKDIAPPQAGFWLLDYWISKSREKGMLYANLGVVWSKGQPKSWKGFSRFKDKFNPRYLILPKEFIKFSFSLKKQAE